MHARTAIRAAAPPPRRRRSRWRYRLVGGVEAAEREAAAAADAGVVAAHRPEDVLGWRAALVQAELDDTGSSGIAFISFARSTPAKLRLVVFARRLAR